ncbi:hypothetical protein TSAR_006200 [Trichomalopsis sarcophagae]|uniref:Uncharacterized protein n=1 Tax=Trichomalopsis sarcophagae TaxID=543379 RepID=A0A232FBF0_9HYME|nr:hypothetical protein TSAR_006200 [Trichomalopsis sarcophagae]
MKSGVRDAEQGLLHYANTACLLGISRLGTGIWYFSCLLSTSYLEIRSKGLGMTRFGANWSNLVLCFLSGDIENHILRTIDREHKKIYIQRVTICLNRKRIYNGDIRIFVKLERLSLIDFLICLTVYLPTLTCIEICS